MATAMAAGFMQNCLVGFIVLPFLWLFALFPHCQQSVRAVHRQRPTSNGYCQE